MTVGVQTWVFQHSDAKLADRLVLLALADEADDDGGSCYPSVDRIAAKARISKRQALRSIERLEEQGELVVDRPEVRGRGFFNRYIVLMGRTEAEARAAVENGDNLPKVKVRKGAERSAAIPEDALDPLTHRPTGQDGSDPVVPRPAPKRRADPFPEAFFVTEPMREWHAANTPSADLKVETAQFADYHRAKGDTARDWVASWRTWMRNAVKFAGQRNGRRSPGSPPPVDPDRGIITDRSEAGPVTDAWLWGETEPEVGQA